MTKILDEDGRFPFREMYHLFYTQIINQYDITFILFAIHPILMEKYELFSFEIH